jgi:ribonuclease BN (tRNA processing enzyme)
MRLTVLGKSPSWQDAGGACSGYLVEDAGTRVLLDCGPGVFGRIREVVDYRAVDAVVLSHLHADHVLDVIPYGSGLRFGPAGPDGRARPALHVPPGGLARLGALAEAASMGAEHLALAFATSEYDPAAPLAVGGLELRFRAVPHFVPTWAIDVRGEEGRLTYGADCGPNDALCELARDTDLLLIEATLPRPEREGDRGHLTPQEAGEHGARAGARRLVLTHFSDELDAGWARAEAAAAFGRGVDLAEEAAVYEIKP